MDGYICQGASKTIELWMFNSADHLTEATGKTVTVAISKAGGAFGAPSGGATATEVGNGLYTIGLSATDTNTLGFLAIRATATGCDNFRVTREVIPAATVNSVVVPSVNSYGAGGILVAPSQGYAQSVGASSITLSASDNDAAFSKAGWYIKITEATTGAGQMVLISAYNTGTRTATVTWDGVQPTGTVGYVLVPPNVTLTDATTIWSAATRTLTDGAADPTTIAAAVITALGATTVDQSITFFKSIAQILAMAQGVTSGFSPSGGTVKFFAPDGVTARITATVDSSGNRQSVTATPPA